MTREDEMERAWEERDQYMRSNVKLVTEIGQLRRSIEIYLAEITKKRVENERLRAWAEDEQRGRHQAEEDRMHARSEVEQLKAGMREYACTADDRSCGCYNQFLSERAEIERWKTEVERLLKQVADLAFAAAERTDDPQVADTIARIYDRLEISDLRTEVERLTEAQMRKDAEAREQIQGRDTEIVRLRDSNRHARENEEMRHENERLKAKLAVATAEITGLILR